jgi:hypothetical protein
MPVERRARGREVGVTRTGGSFPVLVLACALTCVLAALPAPRAAAFDWEFLSELDADDRDLLHSYRQTAARYRQLSDELLRRYQPLPLHIELSRNLERVRWRLRDAREGVWQEAVVCPEDRTAFHDLGQALSRGAAGAGWIPLRAKGERLLAPPGWSGRAVLVRPDGQMVRLILID